MFMGLFAKKPLKFRYMKIYTEKFLMILRILP